MEKPLVLITGATGYIGGRLVHAIDRNEFRLRCLARRPDYLRDRLHRDIEVAEGDVLDQATLRAALTGVDTAYYLIHSMGAAGDFVEKDRVAASNFGAVARACGLRRIVYVGGLGEGGERLSSHLESRQEVGNILRDSGVPVIEFQASIVIGPGSLSFELIRALTERLPLMVTPKWVSVPAQPIAIEDLIAYLVKALHVKADQNPVYQIGGRDVVSYGGLMREYARQRGLRRVMIPVPVLTPWLSSLWLTLFTRVYQRIGRRLVMSLRHPTVVTDDSAREVFGIETITVREAIARALRSEDEEIAETRWSDALSSGDTHRDWGGTRFGNRLIDSRTTTVCADPSRAFAVITRLGGKTGWHYANWLWKLRGAIDVLFGGVGMRRGRRDPASLRTGDVLDCWRVEKIVTDSLLRLTSEMRLPGRAWLEFELEEDGAHTNMRQTAIFDPLGLFGLLYWYTLYPLHKLIFSGMLRSLASVAEKEAPS